MNSPLDLNLLSLARQNGSDRTDLPDLFAVTPPHRAARGREADSLVIYLTMTGNSPLSTEAQGQLLEDLTKKFYKTPGSLTAALRDIADALNTHLLERNLRSTSMGRQGIGQLILAALRADTVYLTQCGLVHAFLVTPTETQHLHDPQNSGRGLGLSRTTPMRFLQVKLNPDDYLVLATQASLGWTATSLVHPKQQGIETIRRALVEAGGQDFNAVIIQAQAGTGKLRLLRRKVDASMPAPVAAATPPVKPIPAQEPAATPAGDKRLGLPSTLPPEPMEAQEEVGFSPSASPASMPAGQPGEDRKLGIPPAPTPAPFVDMATASSSQPASAFGAVDMPRGEVGSTAEPAPGQAASKKVRTPSTPSPLARAIGPVGGALGKIVAAILRALRSASGTLAGALLRLFKSLLPDADVMRMPPSVMIFIALAIPLVLATIGTMVYLQRGRSQEHQKYFQQAVDKAAYAETLQNPLEQRMAWLTVIGELDKAENYTLTTKSQELRVKAIQNLDNLDAIKRLDYQQAIVGGLEDTVRVSRMVATATDLYMLDAEQGSVLRAIMTSSGYVIDANFQCGPTYGPKDVGPLIDIAELPPGSFENASLLGMDAEGNILYCVPGSQPYSAVMYPPNTGFGEPIAMTLDRSDFSVLDPKVNAVWLYNNLEVSQQPRLFFGDQIPPMEDVIDLAVYNDDLFLLHADGHITKCTYSAMAESPTRCEEPYPYSDNRPGRVHGPVIEDAVFNQIFFLSFPERSIYLLDAQNQSVYYFSVLLNLQWQYQPVKTLASGNATAFAISPNRTAFLAIGNQVYYAAMP